MDFRVAVVQMESTWLKPAENLEKAEKFIELAVSRKANVVIFPEEFITGALSGIGRRREKFIDFEGKYLEHFRALAKQYKIDIVPGSWLERKKGKIYNTAYYIDWNGKVKGRYCKNHLWISERSYCSFGEKAPVFKTRFGKVGLAICWDLAFPEHFRELAMKGTKIVFCSSLWYLTVKGKVFENYAEEKHVNAMCISRAFENNLVLVYCNAGGKSEKRDQALGRSQVTMPLRGAVKRLDHNREEMFIQKIDTGILKKAEKEYWIRKDLRERLSE